MHTITATLAFDDTADPPRVSLVLQGDGRALASEADLAPADAKRMLDALAGDDETLRARFDELLQRTVDRLRATVASEQEAQTVRETALASWQTVLNAR